MKYLEKLLNWLNEKHNIPNYRQLINEAKNNPHPLEPHEHSPDCPHYQSNNADEILELNERANETTESPDGTMFIGRISFILDEDGDIFPDMNWLNSEDPEDAENYAIFLFQIFTGQETQKTLDIMAAHAKKNADNTNGRFLTQVLKTYNQLLKSPRAADTEPVIRPIHAFKPNFQK